jgi:HD-GYP domain-containing protein (c-di-GMP phosphodiesterase class II)
VTRDRLLPAFTWATAVAVVPVAVLHFFGREEVHIPNTVHFAAVAAGALTAAAAALALTWAGARRHDGRVVLVGSAFSVMAVLLLVHGIATPELLVSYNGLVGFTGGATLPVGGAILALSALPSLRRPESVRPLLWMLGALLAAIAVVSAIGMAAPRFVPDVPEPRSSAAMVLLVTGLIFYGVLALRALRTFLLTRRHADLAVVCGIAWLAAALVAALTLDYLRLGWWMGHGLEVAGIALVGAVVALDLRRSAESRPLLGDLRAMDLVQAEEAFLGSHVRALMVRLAEKDEYTEGHTRRVALRAVQVGEELGLPRSRLRTLAIGGLLHDIGKLSVPDAILKKPGPLTDEEYTVIRRHPERGYRLLGELGGFSEAARRLVRGHHERLDGSGYPQGLHGDELGLEIRIIGACDVYDALRSARVYRDAWSHEQAIAFLHAEAVSELDPRCVEALERVLARDVEIAESPARPAEPKIPAVPEVTPLLPSVPAVFAGTPSRIVRRS